MKKSLYRIFTLSAIVLVSTGSVVAQSTPENTSIAKVREPAASAAAVSLEAPTVNLTSFAARVRNGKVLLEWHTDSEADNEGFVVQRNARGEWRSIGFVAGHGAGRKQYGYSFSDLRPPAFDMIYYRLKRVHEDKETGYSEVIEARFQKPESKPSLVSNYPNPCTNYTSVSYSLPQSAKVTVKVYDLRGKLIKELVNRYQQAGNHSVVFNPLGIPTGSYMIELGTPSGLDVRRITVNR